MTGSLRGTATCVILSISSGRPSVMSNKNFNPVSVALMRKLPRQVDSPEVETSWLNTLALNTAGGTLPRESWGRYSL